MPHNNAKNYVVWIGHAVCLCSGDSDLWKVDAYVDLTFSYFGYFGC